jgi:hypothetical protein
MMEQVTFNSDNNDKTCPEIANGNLQDSDKKINEVCHPEPIPDVAMEVQIHDSSDNHAQTYSGSMNDIFQDAAEKMEDVSFPLSPNVGGMVDKS